MFHLIPGVLIRQLLIKVFELKDFTLCSQRIAMAYKFELGWILMVWKDVILILL
jgi:hypothetical protein